PQLVRERRDRPVRPSPAGDDYGCGGPGALAGGIVCRLATPGKARPARASRHRGSAIFPRRLDPAACRAGPARRGAPGRRRAVADRSPRAAAHAAPAAIGRGGERGHIIAAAAEARAAAPEILMAKKAKPASREPKSPDIVRWQALAAAELKGKPLAGLD